MKQREPHTPRRGGSPAREAGTLVAARPRVELAGEARHFLRLSEADRQAAESAFGGLDREAALELVRAVEGKERLALLYLSSDCTDLVRALAPPDFYYTVKQVGPWEAHEAIEVASSEQINFLLDHECWKQEGIDGEAVVHWVQLFLECDEDARGRIIRGLHPEFLIAALQGHVRLNRARLDALMIGDQFFCSPDAVVTDRPAIKELLYVLYDLDLDYFLRIMRFVVSQPRATSEADAIEGRESRLRERGFPGFLESQALYDPVDLKATGARRPEESAALTGSRSLVAADPDRQLFIHRLLEFGVHRGLLSDHFFRRVEEEISELTNRLLVADQVDPTDRLRVLAALERARRMVNLGLEHLAGEDLEAGVLALIEHPFEYLFRIGHTLLSRLSRHVDEIGPGLSSTGLLAMLDPPYRQVYQALSVETPMVFCPGADPEFRPIRCLADYQLAQRAVREIDLLVQLHFDLLPVAYREAAQRALEDRQHRGGTLTFGEVSRMNIALLRGQRKEGMNGAEGLLRWLHQHLAEAGLSAAEIGAAEAFWRGLLREQHPAAPAAG